MIRRNQRQLNRLNALTDGALVLLAYLFAVLLWLGVVKGDANMAGDLRGVRGLSKLAYPIWAVLVMACFGIYRTTRVSRLGRELRGVVAGNAIALIAAAAVLYLFRLQEFSRGVLGLFYLFSCALLIAKRLALRLLLRRMRAKGYNLKHVLLVGGGSLADRYEKTVAEMDELGIRVAERVRSLDGLTAILEARLHGSDIDEVILALEPDEVGCLMDALRACEKCGTKASIVPFYNDVLPARPMIDVMGQMRLIQMSTTPLDEPLNAIVKRGMDIIVSLAGLIVLSPLLLVIAVAIKATSPGPVLFRQERVGRYKKPFMMLKFRSMRVNDASDTTWTSAQDDRRTPLGSFLRKTSLDELPQLVNVLRGEMSLVGPRPEIPFFVEQFRETVPQYMMKCQVRPGITGWAQVNGLRGDTSIPLRVEHDLWYIDHWSLSLDIAIIARTLLGGMINDEQMRPAPPAQDGGETEKAPDDTRRAS